MAMPGICGIVWRRGPSVQSVAARPVRWLVLGACVSTGRAFSARAAGRDGSVKHVFVRCKTSGSMIISMYNVLEHPPTTPLLLYLPPSPQPHIKATEDFEGHVDAQPADYTDDLARPPDHLLRLNIPIVSIRYRWEAAKIAEANRATASRDARTKLQPLTQVWPTPLHDMMFAYDWIQEHLAAPPVGQPHMQPHRDLYVYGSYLGASLATSLALTELNSDQSMAIRGVAAYNGIYNWTAFVNMEGEAGDGIPDVDDTTTIQRIVPGIPPLSSLCATPADLFDSFLSPCLFFRTPGLVVPPIALDKEVNRTRFEKLELMLEEMEGIRDENGVPMTTRETILVGAGKLSKAYLAYPPMDSALTIPPALLMHTGVKVEADAAADHRLGLHRGPRKIPEAVHGDNSYAAQASEMASLMRRGIDMYELKRKEYELKRKEAEEMMKGTSQDTGKEMKAMLMLLLEYEADLHGNETDSSSTESEHRVQQVSVGASPRHGSLELGKKGQEILVGWLNEHMKDADGDGSKL